MMIICPGACKSPVARMVIGLTFKEWPWAVGMEQVASLIKVDHGRGNEGTLLLAC